MVAGSHLVYKHVKNGELETSQPLELKTLAQIAQYILLLHYIQPTDEHTLLCLTYATPWLALYLPLYLLSHSLTVGTFNDIIYRDFHATGGGKKKNSVRTRSHLVQNVSVPLTSPSLMS